jgi:hypothetical protein
MSGSTAGASLEPVRRFEVFTGEGRRRKWALADKMALVADALRDPDSRDEAFEIRRAVASGWFGITRTISGHQQRADFQELADETFGDVLAKQGRPLVHAMCRICQLLTLRSDADGWSTAACRSGTSADKSYRTGISIQ